MKAKSVDWNDPLLGAKLQDEHEEKLNKRIAELEKRLAESSKLKQGYYNEAAKGWEKFRELEKHEAKLRVLVNKQAENDGLWFQAQTAPEAYLQQELRKLHKALEE